MKNILIALLAILASMQVKAQSKWYRPLFEKSDWIAYGGQYVAGAAFGVSEQVNYHPITLFKQFPSLNRQWWDSRISWQNKNHEPAIFTAFSDANHFFKAVTLSATCVSVAFTFGSRIKYQHKDLWKVVAKKLILSYIANKIGFATTYYLVFKNK